MIGKKISRYVIEKKLGDGPMGPVWLATDDLIGRQVTLRVLSESLADTPEIRKRFLREARLASGLTHPGIALVLDAGESDDHVFIAFEHVAGETIAAHLNRGPLPEEQAIRVACDVAEALQHAHDKGLLHRDVNSRTIMIDREGHAKLMEFSFATPDDKVDVTSAIPAVTDHIAPEVLAGSLSDARSDVYGLGVVLFEMLTGRLPSKGGPAGEIGPELKEIIEKATTDDPDGRLSSAGELATRLGTLIQETVPPESVGTPDSKSLSPVRRRRPGWRPVAALLLLVGFALVFFNRETVRELFTGDTEEKRVQARELYEQGVAVWSDEKESARQALDLFRQSVELDPNLAKAQVGVGSAILANFYYGWSEASDLEEAEASFRLAIEIDPGLIQAWRGLIRTVGLPVKSEEALILGNELWELGGHDYQTMMAMADAYFAGNLPEYSVFFLREALRLDPNSKEAHYHLVYRTIKANELQEGIAAGLRYTELYGPDPEVDVWVGIAYRASGDLESAKFYFDRALAETGPTTSNHFIFPAAGLCYQELGLEAEARRILQRGLSIMESRAELVSSHPETPCFAPRR